ncbi:hypothetical protein [Cyanobium sp. WAJ14-Wanaka]|uniref:hypothetical protein n=1 Tax=Cyanobium sp. WAJ14-Wanaka TaxID=2823725 RepID=UPI0020CFE4D9|nr:hypothetical protein [Cyanobium sp. WAJ14-Wanaka]
MSPAEDALLLLAIVRRHLRSLRLTLDPGYPDEDWGFTAQQAFEKLLKAWIVLADRQPPSSWSYRCLPWRPATRRGRCERMVEKLGKSAD